MKKWRYMALSSLQDKIQNLTLAPEYLIYYIGESRLILLVYPDL
jgi:hypothetical protein